MKQLNVLFILCLVYAVWTPANMIAQQPFSGFLVFEEHIAPADMPQFDKVQKEAFDLWKKNKFDVPVLGYLTDESSYYWVIPIRSFASIDTLFHKLDLIGVKMEEQGYNNAKKFRDLSSYSSSVMVWDPELSYHPNGVMINSMENRFTIWNFIHLLSGHEKEAADVLKKNREFYEENDLDLSWETFHVMLGEDNPLMIVMVRDKNDALFYNKNSQFWQEHGEKLRELRNNLFQHARKVETKTGWYQERFSNRPNDEKY